MGHGTDEARKQPNWPSINCVRDHCAKTWKCMAVVFDGPWLCTVNCKSWKSDYLFFVGVSEAENSMHQLCCLTDIKDSHSADVSPGIAIVFNNTWCKKNTGSFYTEGNRNLPSGQNSLFLCHPHLSIKTDEVSVLQWDSNLSPLRLD